MDFILKDEAVASVKSLFESYKICKKYDYTTEELVSDIEDTLSECFSADIQPVIHAHWIDEGEDENDPNSGNHLYRCSNCNHSDLQAETTEVPYCWYCGAKMDEVIKDV